MLASAAPSLEIQAKPSNEADFISIVGDKGNVLVVLDAQDYSVIRLAANLFPDDVPRMMRHHLVATSSPAGLAQVIVVGTPGKSAWIQKLMAGGKLKGLN